MLKNYLKIAWRNLWKNKLFSLINISGLAVGVTCCVLIFLYVSNELSYDKYNERADRIFRFTSICFQPKKTEYFATTSPIMSQRIKETFPEVEQFVRIVPTRRTISYQDKKFYDSKIFYADSALFDVFTFQMLQGDAKKALATPYSVVLTETSAKKYFGNLDVVGKMMKLSDTINIMVTGLIKDIPLNSHVKFDAVMSRQTISEIAKSIPSWKQDNELNWFNCDTYSYLLLKEGTKPEVLEAKINAFMNKEMADIKKDIGMWFNVKFQNVTDIHLKSHLDAEYKDSNNSDITYVYIFSAVAGLVLLIACCNFINLSTARSLNRAKEIGLRKVIGARRVQLISQFLGESILLTVIASFLSIILLYIAVPVFNSYIGTELSVGLDVIGIYLAIIIAVGILAGSYPSLLMSSFSPVRSLKGSINHGLGDVLFRKGLVVFQFSIAVILIIGTTLILQQLEFIQDRNIGMNKEQMLSIEMQPGDARKGDVILKELSRNSKVTGGTLNSFSFKGISNITLLPEGAAQNEMTASYVISVDENFLKTFGIQLLAGRDFSKEFPTDVTEAFIVNEAAVKTWGWKTPKEALGKKIEWAFGKTGPVIGVVKDFNFASMHNSVEPMVIHIFPQWFRNITLKLNTTDLTKTMGELEATWKATSTGSPFKYSFLEDDFNALYRSEQNMRTVLSAFTFLSIMVACLGLFGLAAFSIKQRFKEIGIRKVLGANVSGIVALLSKDFLKLVLISIIIAAPIAWYAMHKWLQDFAYKIDISWWVFLIAGVVASLIAFATVSIQAFKAAISNPVKSIRTE